MEKIEVSYSNYIDIRYGKLVLVQRRIEEGFYSSPQVTDLIVGSIIDLIV